MKVNECITCDGTGLVCSICGESKQACECFDFEIESHNRDHPDVGQWTVCDLCE